MRKFRVLFIAAAAVLMSACAASGPKVRTDRDPTANLSSYKTFGFYDQLTGDRARYSTIMSNRLRAATIEQMTKLGYTYDVRAPQLRVNFFLQVANRAEVRSTPCHRFPSDRVGGLSAGNRNDRLQDWHPAHRSGRRGAQRVGMAGRSGRPDCRGIGEQSRAGGRRGSSQHLPEIPGRDAEVV